MYIYSINNFFHSVEFMKFLTTFGNFGVKKLFSSLHKEYVAQLKSDLMILINDTKYLIKGKSSNMLSA